MRMETEGRGGGWLRSHEKCKSCKGPNEGTVRNNGPGEASDSE
jgi:hypothetical protein